MLQRRIRVSHTLAALVVLTALACARRASPVDASTPATPAASAAPPDAAGVDAASDAVTTIDAGAFSPRTDDAGLPARPVVFHAFRRSAESGKVDRVGPRSPAPDGEMDAVFELVLEGDVAALVLRSEASSTSARTISASSPSPAPVSTNPLVVPPLHARPRYLPMKHVPDLYAYEGKLKATADALVLAFPDGGGRRTLRLHTWSPPGAASWRVLAELPDGSIKEGPMTR